MDECNSLSAFWEVGLSSRRGIKCLVKNQYMTKYLKAVS